MGVSAAEPATAVDPDDRCRLLQALQRPVRASGDEALRTIGRCVRQCLRRPGDIGARYGGEEFAIVLPNTDAEGALYVAHAVREAVAACAIAHDRAPMGHVTIRIGVASAANGGNPAALVARADQALYQAKGAAGTAWFTRIPLCS